MDKIQCRKCGYNISHNLTICPFCGAGHKVNKWLISFLVILGMILIGCIFGSPQTILDDKNSTEIKDFNVADNVTNKNENVDKKQKKVYKITSGEYTDYIVNIAKQVYINNQDIFSKCSISNGGCTYIRISCYANKPYTESVFNERIEKIERYIFDELSKNEYKNGSIFICGRDIVQPIIYNMTESGRYLKNFMDFDVLTLKKYSSFDEYINR